MLKVIEGVIETLQNVRQAPLTWLGPDTTGGDPPAFVFINGLREGLKLEDSYPQARGPIAAALRVERAWPHNSAFIWQLMEEAGWTPEAIMDGLLDFEIEVWTRLAQQLQEASG